jgi:chromosome segregation ATPase
MEFEEIIKRVEWLDDQQRKNKAEISDLAGRLPTLQTSIENLAAQLKSLAQQINDFAVVVPRLDQFDQMVAKQRVDLNKRFDVLESNVARRDQEAQQSRQAEVEEIRKNIFKLQSAAAAEEATRKERANDEKRRTLALQDVRASMEAAVRQTTEVLDSQKAIQENQRQTVKRLADLQTELVAVRKRADDAREKSTLHSDAVRNLENRVSELVGTETGRQEQFAAIVQQAALGQLDRERAWKEWQERYEAFKQQIAAAENQAAAFDDSIRAAQRAQEAYDGLNQRLERRIAEVSEIQRLAEERIRQEWVAFKADEQKRWTGHSLAQDETLRDLRKDVEKIESHLTELDDGAQMLQDQLEQTTEATEQELQELMNVAQEWLSAYERIMGHAKTKARTPAR